MKKYFIKNQAITLISLIITIIILLILAGVTINIALGNNGIIKLAEDASEKYKNAYEKELNDLTQVNNEIGIASNRETVNIDKEEYDKLKAKGTWELLASASGTENKTINNINDYSMLSMQFVYNNQVDYTSFTMPKMFEIAPKWCISVHNITNICRLEYISDTNVTLTTYIPGTVYLYGIK